MADVHSTFRDAWRFVHDYLTQVDSLLEDASTHMLRAEHPWVRLRQNGNRHLSDLDPLCGAPDQWLPDHLVSFFAPQASLPTGKSYGVPIERVSRIAFVWAWLGPVDADDTADLITGWFSGLENLSGNAETHLRSLYDALPTAYESETSGIGESAWSRVPLDNAVVSDIHLCPCPLRAIQGPDDLQQLMARFYAALTDSDR